MTDLARSLFIALASSALTFCFFVSYQGTGLPAPEQPSTAQLISQEQPPVNASPRDWSATPLADFVTTSKRVTAAVVNVNTMSASGYRISSGSGVIISSDGYIITNYHVVEDGSQFELTLFDKRKLKAELIGTDPSTDLALLKADNARDLKPLAYGNSDQVEVGQWVLAVGNPFNLTSTVTAGIISAKARNINILRSSYSIESFLQTDAVVNPGNSGGALVNEKGELIGINTAIISESGGYEGYSFAIPANLVRKVIRDIREFGKVQRAVLGISISDVSSDIASRLTLPTVAGVYVTKVNSRSSAAEAGLRSGDVIISINGTKTNSVPELQEQVALFRPGERISLEFYREGRKYRRDNVQLKGLGGEGF